MCPEGATGLHCETITCGACFNGTCTVEPNECQCWQGFQGEACLEFACALDCSGHGICTGPDTCTCEQGWGGVSGVCDTPLCSSDCGSSTGRGACVGPDTCACSEHWTGANCSDATGFDTHLIGLTRDIGPGPSNPTVGATAMAAYYDFISPVTLTGSDAYPVESIRFAAPWKDTLFTVNNVSLMANVNPFTGVVTPGLVLSGCVLVGAVTVSSGALVGVCESAPNVTVVQLPGPASQPDVLTVTRCPSASSAPQFVIGVGDVVVFTCGSGLAMVDIAAIAVGALPIPNTEWVVNAIAIVALPPFAYALLTDGSTLQLTPLAGITLQLDMPGTWSVPQGLLADEDTNALVLINGSNMYRGDRVQPALEPGPAVESATMSVWRWVRIKEPGQFGNTRLLAYSHGLAFALINGTFSSLSTTSSRGESFRISLPTSEWGPVSAQSTAWRDFVYYAAMHPGQSRVQLARLDSATGVGRGIASCDDTPLMATAPVAADLVTDVLWTVQAAGDVGYINLRGIGESCSFNVVMAAAACQATSVTAVNGSGLIFCGYEPTALFISPAGAQPLRTQLSWSRFATTATIGALAYVAETTVLWCVNASDVHAPNMTRLSPTHSWQRILSMTGFNGELFVLDNGSLFGVTRIAGVVRSVGAAGYWTSFDVVSLAALPNRGVWYDVGTQLVYTLASTANTTSATEGTNASDFTYTTSDLSSSVTFTVIVDAPYYTYLRMEVAGVRGATGAEVGNTSEFDEMLRLSEVMDCIQANSGAVISVLASALESTQSRNFKQGVISMINTFAGTQERNSTVPEEDVNGRYVATYAPEPGSGPPALRRLKGPITHPESPPRVHGVFFRRMPNGSLLEVGDGADTAAAVNVMGMREVEECVTLMAEGCIVRRHCNISTVMADVPRLQQANASYVYTMSANATASMHLVLTNRAHLEPHEYPLPPAGGRRVRLPLRYNPSGVQAWNAPGPDVWRGAADAGCTQPPSSTSPSEYAACVQPTAQLLHRLRAAGSAADLGAELIAQLGLPSLEHVMRQHAGVLDLLVQADTPHTHAIAASIARLADEPTATRVMLAFPRTRWPPATWRGVFSDWAARGYTSGTLGLGSLARRLQWQGLHDEAASITDALLGRLQQHLDSRNVAGAMEHVHALVNVRTHKNWGWLRECIEQSSMADLAVEAVRLARGLPPHIQSAVLPATEDATPERSADLLPRQLGEFGLPALPVNLAFNATYGSSSVGMSWSATFDTSYGPEPVVNPVMFNAWSRNNADLMASVFDFEVPVVSASIGYEITSYYNGFAVSVFGETVFWKPLPCILCVLRCRGPAGTLASGHHQFLRFTRTFFVGGVPLEVGVALAGGYGIDYQLQVCVLATPAPTAIARLTANAFVSGTASAGVNLAVVRGGVDASLNIFNGQLEGAGNMYVWLQDLNLTAYILLDFSALTGSVSAYAERKGCGWFLLEWCPGERLPLVSLQGLNGSVTFFNWTYTIGFPWSLTPPGSYLVHGRNASLHLPLPPGQFAGVHNTTMDCPDITFISIMSSFNQMGIMSLQVQQQASAGAMAGSVPRDAPVAAIASVLGKRGRSDDERPNYFIDPTITAPGVMWPPTDALKKSTFQYGHLTPAAQYPKGSYAYTNTFVFSNLSPQYGPFNFGAWKKLECNVANNCNAKLAGGVQWILTGVHGRLDPPPPSTRVPVPATFWKIICRFVPDPAGGGGRYMTWSHVGTNAITELPDTSAFVIWPARKAFDLAKTLPGPASWTDVAAGNGQYQWFGAMDRAPPAACDENLDAMPTYREVFLNQPTNGLCCPTLTKIRMLSKGRREEICRPAKCPYIGPTPHPLPP